MKELMQERSLLHVSTVARVLVMQERCLLPATGVARILVKEDISKCMIGNPA